MQLLVARHSYSLPVKPHSTSDHVHGGAEVPPFHATSIARYITAFPPCTDSSYTAATRIAIHCPENACTLGNVVLVAVLVGWWLAGWLHGVCVSAC